MSAFFAPVCAPDGFAAILGPILATKRPKPPTAAQEAKGAYLAQGRIKAPVAQGIDRALMAMRASIPHKKIWPLSWRLEGGWLELEYEA